jgi:hypothetical protein
MSRLVHIPNSFELVFISEHFDHHFPAIEPAIIEAAIVDKPFQAGAFEEHLSGPVNLPLTNCPV